MRIEDVAIGQFSLQKWSNLPSSKVSVEIQRKITKVEDFLCARFVDNEWRYFPRLLFYDKLEDSALFTVVSKPIW